MDQEVVSEYSPLHNTVLRMLDLFASFLRLQLLPIASGELASSVWHEDVEGWDDRHMSTRVTYRSSFSDMLYRDGNYKREPECQLAGCEFAGFQARL